MSKTFSIAGWCICDLAERYKLQELINRIKVECNQSEEGSRYRFCMDGWVFPNRETQGYSSYVFFGSDVSARNKDYIVWISNKIANELDDIAGYFRVVDFDGDINTEIVEINNGVVTIFKE